MQLDKVSLRVRRVDEGQSADSFYFMVDDLSDRRSAMAAHLAERCNDVVHFKRQMPVPETICDWFGLRLMFSVLVDLEGRIRARKAKMHATQGRARHSRSAFQPVPCKISLGRHRPTVEDLFVEVGKLSPIASHDVRVTIHDAHLHPSVAEKLSGNEPMVKRPVAVVPHFPDNRRTMPSVSSIDRRLIYDAFMEAFADYAMDASRTTEKALFLRASKNAVDFDASVGVYEDDRLVAFTMIGIDTLDGVLTAYDAGTGVIPDFRGHGWAKRMFEHALPALRERGVERFLLEVLQQNDPAIRAYEKSDFRIAREFRSYATELAPLRALPASDTFEIRDIAASDFAELSCAYDWVPSFENRPTALASNAGEAICLGAFDGPRLVGGIGYLRELNWPIALVVHPDVRRKGIGRSLLGALARRVPSSVERWAVLNIDGEDRGMQAFFEALGFTHLIDQYEMVRPIAL